jgi:intein/homing endonuclease
MDSFSVRMAPTIEEEMDHCTVMFGCTTMALSQRVSIYTILTETLKTIQKIILNLFLHRYIANCITPKKNEKSLEKPFSKLWTRLRNGTLPKKVENGIRKTVLNLLLNEENILANASFARNVSKVIGPIQNIVPLNANKNNVLNLIKIVKNVYASFVEMLFRLINGKPRSHVLKLAPHKDKCLQKVYDLEVEHDHCYYANGVLVSNSDAFRYAAMGIKTHGGGGGSSTDDLKAIDKYFGR